MYAQVGPGQLLLAMNLVEEANSIIIAKPMVYLIAPVKMMRPSFPSDDVGLAAPQALSMAPEAIRLRYYLLTHAHDGHNSDFISF